MKQEDIKKIADRERQNRSADWIFYDRDFPRNLNPNSYNMYNIMQLLEYIIFVMKREGLIK